jgi:gentisate 1,2-dioxygenase
VSFDPFAQALAVGGDGRPQTGSSAYFEYSQAADPIGIGTIPPVPAKKFGSDLYRSGESRVVPLDVSDLLRVEGPATSPALCANFVRINAGDELPTRANASSNLFHVMSGAGSTRLGDVTVRWGKDDYLTVPAGYDVVHRADEDSTLYWVHDEPLMRYLGAKAIDARFAPTHYPGDEAQRRLDEVAADPRARERSRVSVLLANTELDQTLTITNTLWAMFGILPKGSLQPPHRHQSVALDLIVGCDEGCYSLLGDLDESGEKLVNTERMDWEPGCAFITPPGRWHSHHNESGSDAHLIPIQDAGLQTYLRTLDIRFMSMEGGQAVLERSGLWQPGTDRQPAAVG